RLYNPTTGRFLTTDPVYGGNANAYEYVTADPLNQYDLDGRSRFRWIGRTIRWFPRAYHSTRAFFHYTPTKWMFFAQGNKHFVMRKHHIGFHWSNHQNRIEWDKFHKWHWNPAGTKDHRSVARGLWAAGKHGLRRALTWWR
uniref:RHS repeat-associated core domain-containing protein n=1 Tax=Streptomyces sp. IBSBF 3136 TaxID=2903524 RepID=UPI002FDBE296